MGTQSEDAYETRTVKTMRGLESKKRAALEGEGWELISQTAGTVRSELTFRRPKPRPPWKLFGALGGALVILFIFIAIMAAITSTGDADEPTSAPTSTPRQAVEEEEEDAAADAESPAVLTPESSEDVAALFAGPTYGKDILERFVDAHHGEVIEFDGFISFLIDSESVVYSTAFVSLGDAQSPSSTGPMFEFSPQLLPKTPPLRSGELSEGQNVRVRGIIGSTYAFEESTTYTPEREDRIVLVVESVESR